MVCIDALPSYYSRIKRPRETKARCHDRRQESLLKRKGITRISHRVLVDLESPSAEISVE